MVLAAKAKITHVFKPLCIGENHPKLGAFTPVHRTLLAQSRVSDIGIINPRETGICTERLTAWRHCAAIAQFIKG